MTDTQPSKFDMRQTVLVQYILYAASAALQFSTSTAILGLIACVVGLAITYAKRAEAAGTLYESHVTWLLRTFWVGGGVILPIATIALTVLVLTFVDFNSMMANLDPNIDPLAATLALEHAFLRNKTVIILAAITLVPPLFWWFARLWNGFHLAKDGKAVSDPKSWWINVK